MTLTKIIHIMKRDGLNFTMRRAFARGMSLTPVTRKMSFRYYKEYRLSFAPSMLTYALFANKKIRNNDVSILEQFITSGDTVIDVGAHIGSTAIVAASCTGKTGRVLTFEPVPKFAQILIKNIILNNLTSVVTVHPFALGSSTKEIFINDNVQDDTANHVSTEGVSVHQVMLDDFTKNISTVALLKIDVEGYEGEVLRGAETTLAKTKVIFIEFYTKNFLQLGYDPSTVINLLKKYFTLYEQDSDLNNPFIYIDNAEYEVNLIGIKNNITFSL